VLIIYPNDAVIMKRRYNSISKQSVTSQKAAARTSFLTMSLFR